MKSSHPAEKGIHSTRIGVIVNILLAFIKGVTGVIGNSYALIADAIESSLDIVSSFIVLGGLRIASRPPDKNHPYGHGKAEPLAATVIGISLFLAAIIIAIQSIKEILTPHNTPEPFTLFVLIIVVIVKELLFRFVFTVGESVNSTAVKSDAWHHRSDAITSAAAFVGIAIALFAGKGYESADDWAALFASGIIAYNAYKIFRPALNEIMDAAPPTEIENEVRTIALQVEGVVGLDKCKIRKMGFEFYVDLHVVVDGTISVREGHGIAHTVKDTICKFNPQIKDVFIHIEPARNI